MNWHPRGFGGQRTDPEKIKQDSWHSLKILVISAEDARLTWPEREFIRQVGTRLYGSSRRKCHD